MAYEYGGDPVSAMFGGQASVAASQEQMKQLPMQTQQMQYTTEQQRVTLNQAEAILNIQRNMAQKTAMRNTSTDAGKLMGPRDQIQQVYNNMLDMAQAYAPSSPELAKQYVDMADKLISNQGLADERHLNTLMKDYQMFGGMLAGTLDEKTGKETLPTAQQVVQHAKEFLQMRPDDAREMYGGVIAQIANGDIKPEQITPQMIASFRAGAMTGLQQTQMALAQVHETTAKSEAESARISANARAAAVELAKKREDDKKKAGVATGPITGQQAKVSEGALAKAGVDFDNTDEHFAEEMKTGTETIRRRMVNQAPEGTVDKKDPTAFSKEAADEYIRKNPDKRIKWQAGFGPRAKKTTAAAGTPVTVTPPAAAPAGTPSEQDLIERYSKP